MKQRELIMEEYAIDPRKQSAIKAYGTQWGIVFRDAHTMEMPEQYAVRKVSI
jgi:hypothetical protein